MKRLICSVLTVILCCALGMSGVQIAIPAARAADTGTWMQLPLYGGDASCLALDPHTPTTLYAGISYGGVFRSTDSGDHWTAVNAGLTNPYVPSLAITPLTPTILYAGTRGGGVFRSTDSGDHWTAVNTGLTSTQVYSVAINPLTPSTLYAGTRGDGIFRSTDSGDD